MLKSISIGSISWPKLLDLIREPTSMCFAYVDSKLCFLNYLVQSLALDKEITHLVIGFDKANTHLVGLKLDPNEIIDALQAHQQLILKDTHICSVSSKQILVLQIENPKQALKHMPIFQEALKETDHVDMPAKKAIQLEEISEDKNTIIEKDKQDRQVLKEDAIQKVSATKPENQGFDATLKAINKRQKKTLTYLKNHKKITNRKFRSLFAVSHKTAHIELQELVLFGLVTCVGSGRSTRYCKANPYS